MIQLRYLHCALHFLLLNQLHFSSSGIRSHPCTRLHLELWGTARVQPQLDTLYTLIAHYLLTRLRVRPQPLSPLCPHSPTTLIARGSITVRMRASSN